MKKLFILGLISVALGLGGVICTGCAGKTARHAVLPKTPEMDEHFKKAETLFYAKRFSDADTLYHSYIHKFSYNVLTSKAYFRLGEIAFHSQNFKQAISDYKKALRNETDPQWGSYAIYKEAVSYSKLNDPRKVLVALDQTPAEVADYKIAVRAASLRVSTAKKLNDSSEKIIGSLELIDAYEHLTPEDANASDASWLVPQATAQEAVKKWVDGEDTQKRIDLYQEWLKQFQGKSSGGIISWKIAKLYYQGGDYPHAATWARDYLQGYSKQEYAIAARTLLNEIDKRGEAKSEGHPLLGVLLPLSGKYAVYGESVLHGIECAAGIYSPCHGDYNFNLLVRDSKGDPKEAEKIVEEFSQNPDVRAVIGPLAQVELDDAVRAAEKAALPMITLSQKADIAKSGAYIFRNFLTVSDQVTTLVNYACEKKHWKRFAILTPENPTGEEYRKAFEEEVKRCGGKLVATSSYPPETHDFKEAVRTLKFSSTEQISGNSVSVDALFVPDVYRKVPGVLAAMQFLKIEGVHLIGGAGWDNPGLLKGGANLEGAIFVDGFFTKSTNFRNRDFMSSFTAAYGVEPTLLEAYAFDTARILGETLKDQPSTDRSLFQKTLSQKKNFPGVTGDISFDEEGDARRKLSILTVDQGEIKEVP